MFSTSKSQLALPLAVVAAPAFGAVGSLLAGTSSTAADFPVPAGVAANDIILVFYSPGNTSVITPASGFTEAPSSPAIGNNVGQTIRWRTYWKRASGADSGTYSFSQASSGFRAGVAMRFTGCITSGNPFDTDNVAAAGDYTTVPATSVTTTGANRLLVHSSFDWGGNGTYAAPSGYTGRFNTSESVGYGIATLVQAAAGSSGSITSSFAGSSRKQAWLGALKAA